MTRFYQPDLSTDLDSPFIRDGKDKLIRRSYWLDMDDRTLVMVMVNGIGANLTNEQKRAHLTDLRREHRIDQVCIQEILPPESRQSYFSSYCSFDGSFWLGPSGVRMREVPGGVVFSQRRYRLVALTSSW